MNKGIFVNTVALEGGAVKIQQSAEHLRDTLANLDKRIDDLKKAWRGKDAASYKVAHHKWNVATSGLNSALDEIGLLVRNASKSYGDTESHAASLFKH